MLNDFSFLILMVKVCDLRMVQRASSIEARTSDRLYKGVPMINARSVI